MKKNNQFLKSGGCFGMLLISMLLTFSITGCSSDSSNSSIDSQNISIEDMVDDIAKMAEKAYDSTKDASSKNQKKFIDAGNQFYNVYMKYFGEDFSIDNEPFKNGKYKGKNKKKYYKLASILDDMCTYYDGIKKKSDRYDALGELPLEMYDYTYNVRQMLALIDGTLKYDDEKFTLEYSDYIVY